MVSYSSHKLVIVCIIIYRHNSRLHTDGCGSLLPLPSWCISGSQCDGKLLITQLIDQLGIVSLFFDDKQAIGAFDNTSWYLDTILNINTIYFDKMVSQIYPTEFNLIKSISLILKPPFYIFICPFLIKLFVPNFMINMTILILKLSISHF